MKDAPGITAEWVAVDWGTTHLRAWAMVGDAAAAEAASDAGMSALARDGFEPALMALIEPWLDGQTTVVACGMVGSRQGWAEAPYRAAPCAPLDRALARAEAADPRLSVRLIPGVSQAAPADVMRGEETQIAGFLAARPGFDGVLALPGTHTKWAHISAGEIVSFRTFMTGELFDLLSLRSILRHDAGEGWDEAAFAEAVSDAMSKPEAIAARLFGLRAEALLSGLAPGVARARLSGFLIGMELAAARPYWLGREVALIGAGSVTQAYGAALTAQGLAPQIEDGGATVLRGLAAAHACLE